MRTKITVLALLLTLGLVAAIGISPTLAKPPDKADPAKVKLTLACTAPGGTLDVTNGGNATVAGNCTVNGNVTNISVPLSSDVDIKIMAAAGVNVTVNITDAAGNHKYNIKGDASNDLVTYSDAAGNDKVDFKGNGGANSLTVTDADGNDKYEVKDTALTVTDGAGNDKYEGNNVSTFSFTDAVTGDTDKIDVKTG